MIHLKIAHSLASYEIVMVLKKYKNEKLNKKLYYVVC